MVGAISSLTVTDLSYGDTEECTVTDLSYGDAEGCTVTTEPTIASPTSPESCKRNSVIRCYSCRKGCYLKVIRTVRDVANSGGLLAMVGLSSPRGDGRFSSCFIHFRIPTGRGSAVGSSVTLRAFESRTAAVLGGDFYLFRREITARVGNTTGGPFNERGLLCRSSLNGTVFKPGPDPRRRCTIRLCLRSCGRGFTHSTTCRTNPKSSMCCYHHPKSIRLLTDIGEVLSDSRPIYQRFERSIGFSLRTRLPVGHTPICRLFFTLVLGTTAYGCRSFRCGPFVRAAHRLLLKITPAADLGSLIHLISALGLSIELSRTSLTALRDKLYFSPTHALRRRAEAASLVTETISSSVHLSNSARFGSLTVTVSSRQALRISSTVSLRIVKSAA